MRGSCGRLFTAGVRTSGSVFVTFESVGDNVLDISVALLLLIYGLSGVWGRVEEEW